jgi:cytochrome c biogenesis protein CcmG, thiol:disulfide interchange protein DsbE
VVRGKGWCIAVVVLLVVVYLVLSKMAAMRQAPAGFIPAPAERTPFGIDFTLPDVQGHLVRLADLRGRPVLINIWATWCSPCREEMPSMNALYKDYGVKGLAMVAIATDAGGKPVVVPFKQAYGLIFPVLLDPQNMVGTQLQVSGIPTSYLLDKRGRVTDHVIGARDWNSRQMRRLVEQLLTEEGGGTTP